MTPTSYSMLSDQAVMIASVLYGLALLAFVADWARGRKVPSDVSVDARVTIGASATSPAPSDASPATSPAKTPELIGHTAVTLTAFAFTAHLVSVIARGLASARAPWGNMYEFVLVGTLFLGAVYLLLVRVDRVRSLGLPVTAATLVMLMLAVLLLWVPAGPLVPALQSYWLVIHVAAALLASGAFFFGGITSAVYLLKSRLEERGRLGRFGYLSRLPSTEELDQLSYRIHAFAFPVWTFAALIAGPIWAKYSWGRYWGWDPKEVWAFITWVVYAAYLHARATAGWKGRGAALLALLGVATIIFNFVGINLFGSGLHSYAGL